MNTNDLKNIFTICTWLITIALTSIPAMAADSAKLDVIGFSQDSNYFAFEQYGIQDGSGFPYSEIYIIDTLTDSWIKGSPIRLLDKEENTPLTKTRGKSKYRSLSLLTKLDITQPAKSITDLTGSGEKTDDPRLSVALQPSSLNPGNGNPPSKILLEQWEVESPPHCKPLDIRPKLFRLLLETGSNNTFILLHEDKRLPKSRGCPLNYAINDVLVAPGKNPDPQTVVVLVDLSQQGFEGLDKRIMAITSQVNTIR